MAQDTKPTKRDDAAPVKPKPKAPTSPPPEDEFGGGDICSPEVSPPTEDDAPLP